VTGPRRHFEEKPFLSQHGRSIGWVRASSDALRPGQKAFERQSGVDLAMVAPPAEPLDMTRRPDSAKHLSKLAQVIRIIQDHLGHKAVSTTMFYTHWLNRGPLGVRSPAVLV